MKKLAFLSLIALSAACSKVPAGYVGVKVYLLGGDKGVDQEVLGTGRYWIGMNEDLFLFPTFTQTYRWTASEDEETPANEQFDFQTKEGLICSVDVGVSYHFDSAKIATLFQTYRKGVDEITGTVLRTKIRNALQMETTKYTVEELYSGSKATVVTNVLKVIKEEMEEAGIIVEDIYFIGSIRPPATILTAINEKTQATQRAQQRENELREAQAEAAKVKAAAEGQAQAKIVSARGTADSQLIEAEAQAKASLMKAKAEAEGNLAIAKSLTPLIVEKLRLERWDGSVPKVVSGSTPIIDLRAK